MKLNRDFKWMVTGAEMRPDLNFTNYIFKGLNIKRYQKWFSYFKKNDL